MTRLRRLNVSRSDDDEVLHLADPDDIADEWDEDEFFDAHPDMVPSEAATLDDDDEAYRPRRARRGIQVIRGQYIAMAGVVIAVALIAAALAVRQPQIPETVPAPNSGASLSVVPPSSVAPSTWATTAVSVTSAASVRPASVRPSSSTKSAKPASSPKSSATQEAVGRIDPEWVASMAKATGIPERALTAYANAQLILAQMQPSCGVGWNTLAAIGYIESDHGRQGGASLLPNGTISRPIVGVPLNGASVEAIPDTDQGRLDGDSTWDRAVGPMQFLPSAWRAYGVDANGDGVADPNNIDDAAVAAGRLLCSVGSLTTSEGWRKAVSAYNHSDDYVNAVAAKGNEYAQLSQKAR